MPQYLLTVIEPSEGEQPGPEAMAAIMRDVGAVDQEMHEAGVWVFAGGLYPPDTATVLRPKGDEVLMTDGPFAEGTLAAASVVSWANVRFLRGFGFEVTLETRTTDDELPLWVLVRQPLPH